jgi:methylmalonyl-CoA/ethylmalonyl-CoA epimerase
MPQIKQINHVAVVVDDMEKALGFWRDALGIELHELRDVPVEKSQVAFLPLPGSEVELVKPTSDDSGIAKYLAKRGPGMHHLCLEVDDIDGMMKQLKSQGIRLINEEAQLAADGKKYAFIHPESTGGVLVELYQL